MHRDRPEATIWASAPLVAGSSLMWWRSPEWVPVEGTKPDGRDIQSHIYSLLLPILSLPSFIIYLFYLYLPSLIRQVSRWINLSLCLLGRLQSGEKANLIVNFNTLKGNFQDVKFNSLMMSRSANQDMQILSDGIDEELVPDHAN